MKKKNFWNRFSNKTTPKKWKSIRNTAAYILAGVVGIPPATSLIPDITTPQWYVDYVWYAVAVLGFIIAYAQSKEGGK